MKLLINEKTNTVLNVGDKVETFRGEKARLLRIIKPKHEGSTGRVEILLDGQIQSFYPSVIDAKWMDYSFPEPTE